MQRKKEKELNEEITLQKENVRERLKEIKEMKRLVEREKREKEKKGDGK